MPMKEVGFGMLLVGLIVAIVASIGYQSWEASVVGVSILIVGGFIFARG